VTSAPLDSGRPGRPRRLDDAAERDLLLAAGFDTIRRNGFDRVMVADVLAETGLGTRSFYRHFATKDDLLRALFRQDAERFVAALTTNLAEAHSPKAALTLWVEAILEFSRDGPRSRRAAVLGSAAAMRSVGGTELRRATDLILAPLKTVLAAGASAGAFRTVDAERDAAFISAIAWDAASRLRAIKKIDKREELREATLEFIERAVGAR
jgi:AcrR family transcriptional regulator